MIEEFAVEVIEGQLMVPSKIDAFLEAVYRQYSGLTFDIQTAAGRKGCAGAAYEISRGKVAVDEVGKKIVEKLKEQPKIVDAARKKIRDSLDALKDKVREPLTLWEEERARAAASAEEAMGKIRVKEGDLETCEKWLEVLRGGDPNPDVFGDRIEEARTKLAEIALEQEQIVKKIKADALAAEKLRALEEENSRLVAAIEAERQAKELKEKEEQRKLREEQIIRETEERVRLQERQRIEKEIATRAAQEQKEIAARAAQEQKEIAARAAQEQKEIAAGQNTNNILSEIIGFLTPKIGETNARIVGSLIVEGRVPHVALKCP